ncbi:ferredoxin [Streptomyces sp. Ag109_O5-10]|uniref:ferredoxin n=2 Tax=unclassified Streptomyces TaxID=2593676 RepID=UPI003525F3A5
MRGSRESALLGHGVPSCAGKGRIARSGPGVVVLPDATPAEERHPAVREAASVCPAAAIHVAEEP